MLTKGDQYATETGNIWSYARRGDLAGVKAALRKHVDIDIQNKCGWTAGHAAAAGDQVAVLRLLRDQGSDFEVHDHKGRTVAHEAARSGSLGTLKFLHTTCRIDLSILNGQGKSQEVKSYLKRFVRDEGADDTEKDEHLPIWFRDDKRNKKGQFERKLPFSGAQKKKQLQAKRVRKRNKALAAAAEEIHSRDPESGAIQQGTVSSEADRNGKIQFIGQTGRQRNRLSSHFRREAVCEISRRRDRGSLQLKDKQQRVSLSHWRAWPVAHLQHPIRPAWNRGMRREELEENEEQYFEAWLEATYGTHPNALSLCHFEHNLEVWRQLWRVLERVDVVCVVADARLPLLHLPLPLLKQVVHELRLPVVVVLNKADLVPSNLVDEWVQYIQSELHDLTPHQQRGDSVGDAKDQAESTEEDHRCQQQQKARPSITVLPFSAHPGRVIGGVGSGGKRKLVRESGSIPPPHSDESVLRLLRACGIEQMPDAVSHGDTNSCRGESADGDGNDNESAYNVDLGTMDAKRANRQARKMKRKMKKQGKQIKHVGAGNGTGGSIAQDSAVADDVIPGRQLLKPPLVVGLIGQPSVGKTSVLNRLLGRKRAQESRTAGSTKYLQTIHLDPAHNWAREVTIVDCPGLLFPATNCFGAVASPRVEERIGMDTNADNCVKGQSGHVVDETATDADSSTKGNDGAGLIGFSGDEMDAGVPRVLQELFGMFRLAQIREAMSAVRFAAERVALHEHYNLGHLYDQALEQSATVVEPASGGVRIGSVAVGGGDHATSSETVEMETEPEEEKKDEGEDGDADEDGGEEAVNEWSCEQCTFLNDSCETKCEMCNGSRPPNYSPETKPTCPKVQHRPNKEIPTCASKSSDITQWSPLLLCVALCRQRGWFMARTGSPDVLRAGLAIIKDVADGVIPLYFRPPHECTGRKTEL
jgi:ribosome biogenesis GTPase A